MNNQNVCFDIFGRDRKIAFSTNAYISSNIEYRICRISDPQKNNKIGKPINSSYVTHTAREN